MTTRVYATPAGVKLGAKDLISPDTARNFVLQIGEAFFHGFVVRKADAYYGYVDRCPHAGLPLAQELDNYLTPRADLISCSWHGALFQISSGLCVGGPCAGQSLTPWPVRIEDGFIVTA
ncbi:2Fe-2S ferredoxin [Asticcacaulis sp. AC466]|uniref:Rieske (2Fe-2S) protein n=1 Tax=Asticcacaulis sp. AC466 TaxID=1282362 RepID=UPI0003C3CA26|nr:Rieske (2Fe-2S) protein [Asticcacaulis sp. AC466]ESQ86365.1 2Fe-2S ferredoxin [Asticcacaulis sp. AC466]